LPIKTRIKKKRKLSVAACHLPMAKIMYMCTIIELVLQKIIYNIVLQAPVSCRYGMYILRYAWSLSRMPDCWRETLCATLILNSSEIY